MKRSNRLFLIVVLIVVFIIAWFVVLGAKSPEEKQAELIEQAIAYMDDGIYVFAAPLLEDAIGYNGSRTQEAENMLKIAYLQMIEQSGIRSKYVSLLEKQMGRADAGVEVFLEAAEFYLGEALYRDAFAVLNDGIARTQNDVLITLYENNRYEYMLGYKIYDDVTLIYGTTVGVCLDGLWGIANSNGELLVPCEYDEISTFSNGRAIVKKDGVIYAIDRNANRIALLKTDASSLGNLANDRIPLLIDGKWYRTTGEFVIGLTAFDQIGMYSEGYAPAQLDGKWGVVDISLGWIIPAEYDGIIMDELGRAYARGAAFAVMGGSVYLFVDGVQVGEAYEDAHPFGNEGYAAVKRNGKWGFIDITGEVMIDFRFDDALSFGQHLAAVKIGDFWGYISVYGEVAIQPEFLQAKSFANGNAPVLDEQGWRFITLLEYRDNSGGVGFF